MSSCSSCGKETAEEALNFGDNGKICDACQLEEDLAVSRPGMGSAWLQLSGAWLLVFLSFCISSRRTSRTSFSLGSDFTETVKYGIDLPGMMLVGLAVLVMFSTLIALIRAYPKGHKGLYWAGRLACLGGLFLLFPLAAYSLYDASPRTYTTTTGPSTECEQGVSSACNTLGVRHDRKGEQETALVYFNKACDLKLGMACRNVALVNMQLPEPKPRAALEAYRRACRMGYSVTCMDAVRLTHTQLEGDGMADLRAELETLCADHVGRSCTALGTVVGMGLGGDQQLERAIALFRPECDQDSGLACMNLAGIYREGSAVPRDLAKADELDRKACKLEMEDSCARMGLSAE